MLEKLQEAWRQFNDGAITPEDLFARWNSASAEAEWTPEEVEQAELFLANLYSKGSF